MKFHFVILPSDPSLAFATLHTSTLYYLHKNKNFSLFCDIVKQKEKNMMRIKHRLGRKNKVQSLHA